jgi:hypothetical protein
MSRLIKRVLGMVAFTAVVAASCGMDARAQGSRKDDIVFNAQGRPMAGASVRVCTSTATGQPCTPLALIYSDPGLTQALANPTVTDGLGNYNFYAAPGRYEIEISGPSIITKQIPNVILPSDPTAPTFTTVTTTSGISAFSLSLSGNLTVNGSAAVTGSLTVGGAPVPSTTQDNQWTSAQRFKGPDPWRDITAYMPAGGCDHSAVGINSNTSGGISSGSTALTLNADLGFKNGCGIYVANAGPTSTLTAPSLTGAPATVIYGGTGSTTVHYKVAAIDPLLGTSAASAAITVSTAPATRTGIDMVAIYWNYDPGAVGYLVWSDATGSYTPLGYSFQCSQFSSGGVCGYIDKGAETNNFSKFSAFPFFPYTPPASATGDALITTIVSGAGTTSLVLAAAATSTVGPNAYVYPDDRPFLNAALAAAATDGTSLNRGQVYIPEGLWYLSGVDFPASPAGVSIVQTGAIQLFGLPIFGTVGGSFTSSGNVSWLGNGGAYSAGYWSLSISGIYAQSQVGALFVVYGSPNNMDLERLSMSCSQDCVVLDALGALTMRDDEVYQNGGSGVDLRIDANTYFSTFDHVDWNTTNNSNTLIPLIWYTGLTSSLQSAVFDFHNNAFRYHTIRDDGIFGGNAFGTISFDGVTSIESNWDQGLITSVNGGPNSVSISGQVSDNDPNTPDQSFLYDYANQANAGAQWNITANQTGFVHVVWASGFNGNSVACTGWTFNNQSTLLNGLWGSEDGTSYAGCDKGGTSLGYDVQTMGVLTAGGNDPGVAALEPMLGHIFRRPIPSVTGTGSGSLSAGTYYFVATVLDAAGRESGKSSEVSQVVGASSSISLSVAEAIYFPISCNIYYGTTAGGEGHYFNSTAVTNGTCTFTFTTTAGSIAATPPIVGNAMRSWLNQENNGNSCLFCGLGGGLGTGFLGFNLTAPQYSAPLTGVQFPFNGGVHSYKFYSASETSAPSGIANVDELYADSAAHRWKKIENNGAVQTVGSADSSACAYQGPASPVTGTGAAATYYSCTLPAGVMGAGQGIIITVLAKHTTGTAAITYTLSFGGTSTTAAAPPGAANQLERITYIIMNNAGSTSAQTISTLGQDSNAGTNSIKLDTAAVSTASAVTINLQFNVAATDAITPGMFLVELKQ